MRVRAPERHVHPPAADPRVRARPGLQTTAVSPFVHVELDLWKLTQTGVSIGVGHHPLLDGIRENDPAHLWRQVVRVETHFQ